MKKVTLTLLQLPRFFWISAVLLLAAAFSAHAANPPTSNSVVSVEPATLPGGKTVVRIGLKQPLNGTPAGFTVGNPPRIALDLADTGNAMGKSMVEANFGPLVSVNVVQAGTRTRLVFNLNKPVEYEAKIDGKTLLVSLSDTVATAASVNASPQFAEAASSGSRHAIKDVDFRRGPNGEGKIIATLSDTQTGINIRQQAKGVIVDFIDTDLPKALQRRMDVADFATPVQIVESYKLGENTRMVIEPKGGWEYSAYQTNNQFIVEVKPSTDAAKKTPDGKPIYRGEKLSLNFQNVEVRSVLQVIADFTGLNIVASDTVAGNLTLRLKDVPWDQALDLIMQTKGLDKRSSGNVIWIAPKDELLSKEKLEFEAKAAVADLEPMATEYISLNYLRADEAQAMLYGFAGGAFLQGASDNKATCSTSAEGVGGAAAVQASQQGEGKSDQKILSKRGRATYELKTNTLIVNDVPRKIQEIRDLLARIDVPARQVMIEARIVLADELFGQQLGARLGLGLGRKFGGGDWKTSADVTGKELAKFYQETVDSSGKVSINSYDKPFYNVNLPAPVTASGSSPATFGLTLLNAATGNLISLELQALEADNRGKIVSNPRVVTSNQKPAVILQGVQIPYVTLQVSSGVPTYTVAFKDALLCLLVDPQILNNDSIIMTVEVQKDSVGQQVTVPGGGTVPGIDTKRVKTQVRVNNGETVVLGGVYEQVSRKDVDKVPVLGDIPFFGNLFKNSSKQEEKVELLVFLTPRIVDERLSLR
jgi:type IV pilus assembly protein PilQ